jgi:hypothetical protein
MAVLLEKWYLYHRLPRWRFLFFLSTLHVLSTWATGSLGGFHLGSGVRVCVAACLLRADRDLMQTLQSSCRYSTPATKVGDL